MAADVELTAVGDGGPDLRGVRGVNGDAGPRVPRVPRVKPEHAPFHSAPGVVRVGGASRPGSSDIEDPDGRVWRLLGLLDGSRDSDAVVAMMAEVTAHDGAPGDGGWTRRALARLWRSGVLEDAGEPVPRPLSERETERYDRTMRYFRWADRTPRASSWEPQLRLKSARVAVIGVGGTGGVVAQVLAGSGVGHLSLVDHDTVELADLHRQILFVEHDIGRSKVDAAAERLRALNSDIEVVAHRCRLADEPAVADLFDTGLFDLVVLAADGSSELTAWVNRSALSASVPWVHAEHHASSAAAALFVPDRGPCWECHQRALDPGDADHDEVASEAGLERVACAPAVGVSGSLSAHLALAALTDVAVPRPGVRYQQQLDAPERDDVDTPRDPWCPACGNAAIRAHVR